MQRCLVVCASRRERTCRVGAEIANSLRVRGVAVDLQCGREIGDLDQYDAVVLGAPLCHGRWGRETMRFLRLHREALQSRDVAVFALRPCDVRRSTYDWAWNRIIRILTRLRWLDPVRIEVFPDRDLAPAICEAERGEIDQWCHTLDVSMHLTDDDVSHGTL